MDNWNNWHCVTHLIFGDDAGIIYLFYVCWVCVYETELRFGQAPQLSVARQGACRTRPCVLRFKRQECFQNSQQNVEKLCPIGHVLYCTNSTLCRPAWLQDQQIRVEIWPGECSQKKWKAYKSPMSSDIWSLQAPAQNFKQSEPRRHVQAATERRDAIIDQYTLNARSTTGKARGGGQNGPCADETFATLFLRIEEQQRPETL